MPRAGSPDLPKRWWDGQNWTDEHQQQPSGGGVAEAVRRIEEGAVAGRQPRPAAQGASYVVLQVILKEKLRGRGSGNLTELERALNAQASLGNRLHTIATASSGSKGLGGGDRIQATMVFERLAQRVLEVSPERVFEALTEPTSLRDVVGPQGSPHRRSMSTVTTPTLRMSSLVWWSRTTDLPNAGRWIRMVGDRPTRASQGKLWGAGGILAASLPDSSIGSPPCVR